MAATYGKIEIVDLTDVASVAAIETAVNAQIDTDEDTEWILISTEVRVQNVNGSSKTLMYLTYQLDSIVTPGSGDADLIVVDDTGLFFTGTNVETVLAELGALRMRIVADPGTGVAIPVTSAADVAIVTAAAETNTLADPAAALLGAELHLWMLTRVGGDRVVTAASPVNATGNTILTFGVAGDSIVLKATRDGASAYRWRVLENDGVALS